MEGICLLILHLLVGALKLGNNLLILQNLLKLDILLLEHLIDALLRLLLRELVSKTEKGPEHFKWILIS